VWLADGQVLRLRLGDAPRWKQAVDRRLDGHARK
jgi:hypothetical protein